MFSDMKLNSMESLLWVIFFSFLNMRSSRIYYYSNDPLKTPGQLGPWRFSDLLMQKVIQSNVMFPRKWKLWSYLFFLLSEKTATMWRIGTLILWQCPFSWLLASSRYFCIHGLVLLAVTYYFCVGGWLAEVVTLAVTVQRRLSYGKNKVNGWTLAWFKNKAFICMLYEMASLEYWTGAGDMLILSRLCLVVDYSRGSSSTFQLNVISMECFLLSEGTVTLGAQCLDDKSAQMRFP